MSQYLVFSSDDPSVDLDRMLVTSANSQEGAKRNYAFKVGIKEEWFVGDVYTRSVNMSFAERFFLQTETEVDQFVETGETLVDYAEFERRVRAFFPFPDWADVYLEMWGDTDTPNDALRCQHPFPTDMLCFMYLNYDSNGDGLAAVLLEELKRE